jgi:hypothetical protein
LRTRSVRLASAKARIAADKLDDYWYHLYEKPKPVAELKDDPSPTLIEALEC